MKGWFWQDHSGREIDLLLQAGNQTFAIEGKSGQTFNPSFLDHLISWQKLSDTPPEQCAVIYGGDTSFTTSSGRLISWREWTGSLAAIPR